MHIWSNQPLNGSYFLARAATFSLKYILDNGGWMGGTSACSSWEIKTPNAISIKSFGHLWSSDKAIKSTLTQKFFPKMYSKKVKEHFGQLKIAKG